VLSSQARWPHEQRELLASITADVRAWVAGLPMTSSRIAPPIISIIESAISACRNDAQCEQRCPHDPKRAERRIGDLFRRAVESTIIAFWPPVSQAARRSARHAPRTPVDRAAVRPIGEAIPRRAGRSSAKCRLSHREYQLQDAAARQFVHQLHSAEATTDCSAASRPRRCPRPARGDLPPTDSRREFRTDAHEDAATARRNSFDRRPAGQR